MSYSIVYTARIKSITSEVFCELVRKKMPKLKTRSTSQRNAEMARRMRERRIDDDFRLLENRRRATSHKIDRQGDELRTEENKKRAEAHKIERQSDEFRTEENKKRAEAHKIERPPYWYF